MPQHNDPKNNTPPSSKVKKKPLKRKNRKRRVGHKMSFLQHIEESSSIKYRTRFQRKKEKEEKQLLKKRKRVEEEKEIKEDLLPREVVVKKRRTETGVEKRVVGDIEHQLNDPNMKRRVARSALEGRLWAKEGYYKNLRETKGDRVKYMERKKELIKKRKDGKKNAQLFGRMPSDHGRNILIATAEYKTINGALRKRSFRLNSAGLGGEFALYKGSDDEAPRKISHTEELWAALYKKGFIQKRLGIKKLDLKGVYSRNQACDTGNREGGCRTIPLEDMGLESGTLFYYSAAYGKDVKSKGITLSKMGKEGDPSWQDDSDDDDVIDTDEMRGMRIDRMSYSDFQNIITVSRARGVQASIKKVDKDGKELIKELNTRANKDLGEES